MELLELYNKIEDKYKNYKHYIKLSTNTEKHISLSFLDNCLTDEDVIKNRLLNHDFDIFNEIKISINAGKLITHTKLKIHPTYKYNNNYYGFQIYFDFINLNIFTSPNKIFKYIESANKIISNLSVTDKELIKCFKKNKSFLITHMNPAVTQDFKNIKDIFYEKIKRYNLITKDNITDFLFFQANQYEKGLKWGHSIDVYSFLFSLIIERRIIWSFLNMKILIKT